MNQKKRGYQLNSSEMYDFVDYLYHRNLKEELAFTVEFDKILAEQKEKKEIKASENES